MLNVKMTARCPACTCGTLTDTHDDDCESLPEGVREAWEDLCDAAATQP